MSDVMAYFNGVEANLCIRMNDLSRNRAVRRLFSAVSRLGDGGFWALLALLLFALRGVAALPQIIQIGATGLAGILVYKVLKAQLVRERPFVNHAAVHCAAAPLDRYSFPSGHTLHAVSFSILLTNAEPLLLVVAAPFAILVAASRVILGLHYPSDVLAGAILGALLAASSLAVF